MQESHASQTEAAPSTMEEYNLRHYWHVVLERRWLVITAFISVFVLCLIYLFRATPIYQASVRLQINRESSSATASRDQFAQDIRDQDYLQTQYQNLQSRSLLERVINNLALEKDEYYEKEPDKVNALLDTITISPVRLTRLAYIRVDHPKPAQAVKIANELANEFIKRNAEQKKQRLTSALGFLEEEAKRQAKLVTEAEETLQKYRLEHKLSSLTDEQNEVVQAFKNAKLSYDAAEAQAKRDVSVVTAVHKAIEDGASPDSIPQVIGAPNVVPARSYLEQTKINLPSITNTYGPKHKKFISAFQEVEQAQENLKVEVNKAIRSLEQNAQQSLAAFQSASNIFQIKKDELGAYNQDKVKYEVLQSELEQKKLLYDNVLRSLQETQLSQNDTAQNIVVVDAAYSEPHPVKPRKLLTIAFGIIGGLGVGIGLAFFVNYLDDSIKSQDDVETYLRLPFLGYVPNIKTNSVIERDLQAHTQPQSNAAEGFRTVRAAISLSPRANKQKVISVTSTIPSEGKSLVASNLAIVIAQTGLKTVLIDADLRRPSVHKAYELQSPIGLSSYLQEKVQTIDDLVHTTEVPNLDVICCGAVPQNPSELVGSKRMAQFLEEVRGRYDRVILDCPPVSAVSDPLVISAISDGVVFVTKFNKIRREHAHRSIQRIQDAGVHIMGVVLNDIDFEGKDSYYYSYYYYQNRYYNSYKSDPSETTAKKS